MLRSLSCARTALLWMLSIMLCGESQNAVAQQFDPFGGGAGAAPPVEKKKVEVRQERAAKRFDSGEQDILAALDKPVKLEFAETPLGDAAAFVRDVQKINVEINRRALEDVGIDEDTPITLHVRKISLRSALRLMLRPLDLTFVVRGGTLTITTPEEAESEMITTVYSIGKLLGPVDPLVDDFNWAGDELIDVITATVRPTTWEEVGGPGSIVLLRDKLVVSQTPEVHRELAELLAMLEEAHKVVAAAGSKPPKVTSLPTAAGWKGEIEKALAKPTTCDFIETPLKDVADFFADAHGINVLIDRRSLEDVGLGMKTPVTRRLAGVSLGAALRLILKEMDCTYVIRDEVLLVTTPEEAESELQTRVFPVHDLVYPAVDDFLLASDLYLYGNTSVADYDSLIDLITSTVRPTAWEEVGGPGAIEPYNGCLVFAQTGEVFDEIALLLAGIRKLKSQYQADPDAIVTESLVLDEFSVPNLAKLRAALAGEVGMLAFKNSPLHDVVKALAEKHDVPMLIDHRALEDVGIGSDTPITATLGGESLGEALRRILKEMDLTYIIRDEVILISTPEEAESELLTRVYPVRDLVMPEDNGSLGADLAAQADFLIEVLTRTARPTTWEEVGGPGAIEEYPACFGLVVSQTEEVHQEVAELLAQIRKTDQAKADAADEGEGAKPQVGEPVLKNKAGERLHLKVYRLSTRERDEAVELAEVIGDLIEPQSWKSDDAYYLKPLAGSIIVRHTAPTHRKIHRLLTELDAVAWPAFGGGGGAFGNDNVGFGSGLGGLGGGVFAVPDHIRGQIGGFGAGLGGRLNDIRPWHRPRPPVTPISALSLPRIGENPAMPLAVYHLTGISDEEAGHDIGEAISELIAADDWQTASGAYLRPVGRKLIVRHRADVHRGTYRLLVKLGAIHQAAELPPGMCGSVIPVVGER